MARVFFTWVATRSDERGAPTTRMSRALSDILPLKSDETLSLEREWKGENGAIQIARACVSDGKLAKRFIHVFGNGRLDSPLVPERFFRELEFPNDPPEARPNAQMPIRPEREKPGKPIEHLPIEVNLMNDECDIVMRMSSPPDVGELVIIDARHYRVASREWQISQADNAHKRGARVVLSLEPWEGDGAV